MWKKVGEYETSQSILNTKNLLNNRVCFSCSDELKIIEQKNQEITE